MKRIFILLSALAVLWSCSSDDPDVKKSSVQPLDTDTNLIQGAYTVNANGKKVQFTKGNLYCNTIKKYVLFGDVTWGFEDSQVVDYSDISESSLNHVAHFFWTGHVETSYARNYSESTNLTTDTLWCDGCDADHKLTVDGTSDLYVLSASEWKYLFNTRSSRLKKENATVNGVKGCVVFAPDDYTGTVADSYSADEWSKAEASGFVCLAPAGYRDVQYICCGGTRLMYWSATPCDTFEDGAYFVFYDVDDGGSVNPADDEFGRYCAMSIRLVKTLSE